MKNFFSLKNSLLAFAATAVFFAAPAIANAYFIAPSISFPAKGSDNSVQTLKAEGIGESLTASGVYSATYKITSTSNQPISFTMKGQSHHCVEPHGHLSLDGQRQNVCEQVDAPWMDYAINLNQSNNYTQNITLTTSQPNGTDCGTYQTDIYSNMPSPHANGFVLASIKYTEKTCVTVTPTPTPTPSVTPTPTPSVTPTPTPTPLNVVQCPMGHIAKIENSTVVCVSQNQEQHQEQHNNQTQNNNNNQDLNVTVNPHIENTNNVTVNNPAPAASVVVAGVSVTNQAPVSVKELPKTGLPLAAVGIASLLPVGSRLRKLGQKNSEESANSVWMEKQFKA